MQNQASLFIRVYVSVVMFAIAGSLLFGVVSDLMDGDIDMPGALLLFLVVIASLFGGIGVALLFAGYSKAFGRRVFPELEEPPPAYECTACQYDLRGSVYAGLKQCSECGKPVPDSQIKKIERLAAKAKEEDVSSEYEASEHTDE